MPDLHDDLGDVCGKGLVLAEELGAAATPPAHPQKTFVEIVDETGDLQIAIGIIRTRAPSNAAS